MNAREVYIRGITIDQEALFSREKINIPDFIKAYKAPAQSVFGPID